MPPPQDDRALSTVVSGGLPWERVGGPLAGAWGPGAAPPTEPSCSAPSFFLRLCSEVPILEDTLMRILVIGLSRELPLGPADAMELADHLVKRAAAVQADGKGPSGLCPSLWR